MNLSFEGERGAIEARERLTSRAGSSARVSFGSTHERAGRLDEESPASLWDVDALHDAISDELRIARDSLGDDAGENLVDRMKIAIARTCHYLASFTRTD